MTSLERRPDAEPPGPPRPIRVRRIHFRYDVKPLERHFVQGDLVMSHVVAVLSAFFPPGEDFFVRSVRHYADRITDPALKKAVAGFTGQEVSHGRQHRELNDQLQLMGYPTHRIDRRTTKGLNRLERWRGPRYRLAVTAALEHYTATLAETLLSDPRAREVLGDSEVRSVLLWHALEESEHKAVAFDVYRAVGGTERMRRIAMWITSVAFIGVLALHATLSMLADRATYHPVRLVKSIAALRHSPFLTRAAIRRVRAYNRPGFHPGDNDNAALLDEWTARLFGEQGSLTDHLS
ncbi:MAG TPA: metal-dependent hydrolase [Mycobacterium sp.]|nr:metal-dependent hydrolase [Mycobacterium sp.]